GGRRARLRDVALGEREVSFAGSGVVGRAEQAPGEVVQARLPCLPGASGVGVRPVRLELDTRLGERRLQRDDVVVGGVGDVAAVYADQLGALVDPLRLLLADLLVETAGEGSDAGEHAGLGDERLQGLPRSPADAGEGAVARLGGDVEGRL